MRLSTVILPTYRWAEGQKVWRRAEELGFHAAYTYDHLSWRSFQDRTWFGTVPTLTAAATVTERIRLGTLVTSPNFRHAVTLAKDLISIDDVSNGRLTVGVGAGGSGFDATALGQVAWTARERADRFAEFLPLLARLLSEPIVSAEGAFYAAQDVRMIPGPVQQPRPPLYVAATGPRGLALVARHGQGWVTYGAANGKAGETPAEKCPEVIAGQLAKLADACQAEGRDPAEMEKVLLHGSTQERALDSLDAFIDYAGRYRELGITEIVLHWPVPDSIFDADPAVFKRIATEGLDQLK